MKKALQITLNGIIFTIEEDAYSKLSTYLDSIKKHYGEKEGGEIISDIEASIAEKLSGKLNKAQEVIAISHVEEIIRVMGTVSDFGEDAEQKNNSTEKNNQEEIKGERPKRLYRNPDDSIIGGVCSGIAFYFGIDPVFVRLAFVVFTLFSGIGIVAYFIFWVITPEAKTNSQKLEMQGEPVNLQKLEQVIKEKSVMIKNESKEAMHKLSKKKPLMHKILNLPIVFLQYIIVFCKKFFAVVFPVLRILVGLGIVVGTLFTIISTSVLFSFLIFNVHAADFEGSVLLQEIATSSSYYITLSCGYFVILIPLIFSLFLGVTILRKRNAFNLIVLSILLGFWILAIIFSSAFGFETYIKHKDKIDEYAKEHVIIEENNSSEYGGCDYKIELK